MLNYTDVKNVDIQKNIQLAMNKGFIEEQIWKEVLTLYTFFL